MNNSIIEFAFLGLELFISNELTQRINILYTKTSVLLKWNLCLGHLNISEVFYVV
ncbi:hypothetical protein [Clostridium yunnanense]|uniref:hypothetical protein n=1 Tax=Clostridium yunnanense TaxID=2800325 RepID=UPI001A9C57BC|nr:hypothetical protein [Clostridium yunnanense]